ncbi:MAG: hypothetical protein KFB94_07690 [Methylophilaceae bacterium]|jgi:hypothetical protein|nr:MAG: hypothetical protein KFB94_07690 [Methylophilaceae bacterium]
MKRLTVLALLAFCTACSSVNTKPSDSAQTDSPTSVTSESAVVKTLPTEERAFVDAIELLDKKAIVAQLGEPAKADDVKIKGTNRIVASIWHYHNINTDENGVYYQTTELDFIDDKVVQVVFLNNDGSETTKDPERTYELPK